PSRVAQNQRITRDACERTYPTAVDLRRSAPGSGRAVARGRAAHSRTRQFEMVERGASWRVPRLQPEREGPDDMLGLLGSPASRPPCAGAPSMAGGSRLRASRL